MKRVVLVIACGLVAVSCSGGSDLSASVISTLNTIGTGEQRILVELRDGDGVPTNVTDGPVATLRDENGSPLGTDTGELAWLVPDEEPAYAFVFDIPEAETYQLTVVADDFGETAPAGFDAVERTVQLGVGELVPEVGGHPVPGPAIVVFASPRHCPSRSCVPMLAQAQAAADASPEVGLVGVEVFANPDAEDEADLVLSPDVQAWMLPSQPWLYVIDGSGRVSALFEGAVADVELQAAIAEVEG